MQRLFLVFLVFLGFPVQAAKQYYDLTIKDLSLGWGGEGVYVWVFEDIQNSEGCTANVFKLNADAPLFDQNYAMLLSAYHADGKVGLYVDGCDGNNLGLKAVRLRKGESN